MVVIYNGFHKKKKEINRAILSKIILRAMVCCRIKIIFLIIVSTFIMIFSFTNS